MAFGSFVQGVFTDDPGSPSGVSVGTVTTGNLLIAAFARATNSTPTVTDNLGHTWALARSHYSGDVDYRLDVWYAVATSSGACTITITVAGGAREAIRAEYEGPFDGSAPLDNVNSATATSGTTSSSGNVTPTVTGVLAIGYHGCLSALTSSGSWATNVNGNTATNAATILQSQVRANTTAFAATATHTSNPWLAVNTTFRPSAAAEEFEIAAEAGSYAITGTAASLEADRIFNVDSGTYAITGADASLELGFLISAEAGSYAITGTAAGLEAGRIFSAEAGSYLLSGSAVDLQAGRIFSAEGGSYAISGTDATLTYTPAGGGGNVGKYHTYTRKRRR